MPCTLANLSIGVALAGASGAFAWQGIGMVAGIVAASAVLAITGAGVYLRGYLIPATPGLSRRLLPGSVHRESGKPAKTTQRSGQDVDVGTILRDAGVVQECPDADDLCVTDEFSNAWHGRMENVRELPWDRDELAQVFDVDPGRLLFKQFGESKGGPFVAYLDDRATRIGQWESRAAYLADIAGSRELRDRYARWPALDVREQGIVLNALRVFLQRCPNCDGPVTLGEETVKSCCDTTQVVVLRCEACGSRLFES